MPLFYALLISEAAVSASALLLGMLTQRVDQCSAVSLMLCSESTHKECATCFQWSRHQSLQRPSVQDTPAKKHPGEVLEIESEEELDKILQEEKGSLTILLGSLTWCRPCKTLAKPLQVLTLGSGFWCLRHGQSSASASSERPSD